MKYIVVHHTGVSRSINPNQWKATNDYHKSKWGMKSKLGYYGGYNFQIEADGTVGQYREIGEETVAATGYNFNSIHICLTGNFDIELPTEAQKISLKKLLERYTKEYWIFPSNIIPHRATGANKSCYGNKLSNAWARDLLITEQEQVSNLLKQIEWLKNEIAKLLKRK